VLQQVVLLEQLLLQLEQLQQPVQQGLRQRVKQLLLQQQDVQQLLLQQQDVQQLVHLHQLLQQVQLPQLVQQKLLHQIRLQKQLPQRIPQEQMLLSHQHKQVQEELLVVELLHLQVRVVVVLQDLMLADDGPMDSGMAADSIVSGSGEAFLIYGLTDSGSHGLYSGLGSHGGMIIITQLVRVV
jgi:hypothetical protein